MESPWKMAARRCGHRARRRGAGIVKDIPCPIRPAQNGEHVTHSARGHPGISVVLKLSGWSRCATTVRLP